jgi:hypothetical protein
MSNRYNLLSFYNERMFALGLLLCDRVLYFLYP